MATAPHLDKIARTQALARLPSKFPSEGKTDQIGEVLDALERGCASGFQQNFDPSTADSRLMALVGRGACAGTLPGGRVIRSAHLARRVAAIENSDRLLLGAIALDVLFCSEMI